MLFRTILLSTLALGAAAWLAAPATAAELPKEGTCKFKVTTEGKQVFSIIDRVRLDGVASWDENQKIIENCDRWPSMTRHCFGLNELTKGSPVAYGYCVGTDPDGDAIVWKLLPHPVDSADRNLDVIPDEVLMASGKYAGMTGKATSRCSFSGSPTDYTGTCDVEMTYKIP
jgi:hypothetical protein